MISNLWNYRFKDNDIFDNWSNWVRWILSIPISYGIYSLLFFIFSLVNGFTITEQTFLGALFIRFFFALIPINIFFLIVPKYKLLSSIILSSIYLLISSTVLIIDIYEVFSGVLYFWDFISYTFTNIVVIGTIIFILKVHFNSIKFS